MFSIISLYQPNPYACVDEDTDPPLISTLFLVIALALLSSLLQEAWILGLPLMRLGSPLQPKFLDEASTPYPPPLPVYPPLSPYIAANPHNFPLRKPRTKQLGIRGVMIITLLCYIANFMALPLRQAMKLPERKNLIFFTTSETARKPKAGDNKP